MMVKMMKMMMVKMMKMKMMKMMMMNIGGSLMGARRELTSAGFAMQPMHVSPLYEK